MISAPLMMSHAVAKVSAAVSEAATTPHKAIPPIAPMSNLSLPSRAARDEKRRRHGYQESYRNLGAATGPAIANHAVRSGGYS